jgi:hypothetical protein
MLQSAFRLSTATLALLALSPVATANAAERITCAACWMRRCEK